MSLAEPAPRTAQHSMGSSANAWLCSVGAAVEFSWAAGEAVLVPHLARQGVSKVGAPALSATYYHMSSK